MDLIGQQIIWNKGYPEITIEDLFRQITFIDEDLGKDLRSELERNIAKFTDYRTYLKFDLIVTDGEGRKQHLSKTLLKKSGGETQTPFYISVLASFAQMYRTNDTSNTKNQTVRLIVFDEAHKLRNVYKKSNVIANILRATFLKYKKVLLTATPLQNNLKELYGQGFS